MTAKRWTLDYIEDAATARVLVAGLGRPHSPSSNYSPPLNGVHLCGETDNGVEPTTVARYLMTTSDARRLFELAKSVAECPKEEAAFVVDLCQRGDITDDFWTNRQLWPRAIDAWNVTLESEA